MQYICGYETPVGFDDMMMSSDGEVLTGLWFEHSQDSARHSMLVPNKADLPIFDRTRQWLDIYYSGHQPDFVPQYSIGEATPFRREVSDIMMSIQFGETMTYGEIAGIIADWHGIARMAAQAVGGAVGWNPICIIVPCHRVLGAAGKLTGYGGGMHNKIALLRLEGHNL